LIAFGYHPVLANVTNNLGVLPGGISGALGYRRELRTQLGRLWRLMPASIAGGAIGALLLLRLPASAFKAIVPVLIILALILVVAQPWLTRRLDRMKRTKTNVGVALVVAVGLTAVYGGYFGAAQGVLLMAILATFLAEPLRDVNPVKNVLAASANGSAAVVFLFTSHIAWGAALLIAAGSICGGQIGARVGRKLPPVVYRVTIVVVGIVAIVRLLA
jgi:uncharacterized membrane protein YfcA